jgi:protein TonB
MKKLLFVALFLASQGSFSQETITPKTVTEDNNIYSTTGIEMKPEYPGGTSAFYKFVGKNYNVPSDKNFKGGKVYASFVIEKDGSLTEVKILRDCGFGSGDEAKRVLLLSPKWKPAMQNNVPVRCMYTLPITLSSN